MQKDETKGQLNQRLEKKGHLLQLPNYIRKERKHARLISKKKKNYKSKVGGPFTIHIYTVCVHDKRVYAQFMCLKRA